MKKILISLFGTIPILFSTVPIINSQTNGNVTTQVTDKEVADTLNLIKVDIYDWNVNTTGRKVFNKYFTESLVKRYLSGTPEIQATFTYSKFNVKGWQFRNVFWQWVDLSWDGEMQMMPGLSYRWKYDYGSDTNRLWEFYTRIGPRDN